MIIKGIVLLCIAGLLITSGCISESPQSNIVSCSYYSKVTDDYSTPSGHYLIFDDGRKYSEDELVGQTVFGGGYSRVPKIGEYVSCRYFQCRILNLTPLTEQESGMRDACRVESIE